MLHFTTELHVLVCESGPSDIQFLHWASRFTVYQIAYYITQKNTILQYVKDKSIFFYR